MKNIAVLCNNSMQFRSTIKYGPNDAKYLICTTPQDMMGLEFDAFTVAVGFKEPPKDKDDLTMFQRVQTRIRK